MTTYALLHTIFFFFVYAFLGWCVEVAYAAITTRELVNRGFLNGPICPIYGCGMTVMIAVLGRFTMPSSDMAWYQNVLVAFFGGMVITTLVELVGGYILYKMFHTRWWDYSMYRFNLGGFICPQFSLLWGLGSVLLMVVVHPLLSKPSAAIPTLVLIWLDVIFGGLFLADLIVSAIQAVGFSKQLARIDELRKAMRTTSDALTEVIGTSAMTMDTLLDEQKLQLTLAAMEGATNAAELRDQLRELAGKAGTLRDTTIRLSKQRFFGTGRLLRAFPDMKSLTYAETLEAFRDAGAEVVFFSPLRDTALPENIGGLYLPGGYPELYAQALSENKTMRASIRQAVQAGLPTAAECGGFLYLGQTLEDDAGTAHPMAGVLPGQGFRVGRLVRFGYAALTPQADSMLFRAGEPVPVHEFHHWDSTCNGTAFAAQKANGRHWDCGFANGHLYAGFPHLYWADTPLPQRFVTAAAQYAQTKTGRTV